MKRILASLAVATALVSPAWADSGILPDPVLTPGASRTTNIATICETETRTLRHWSRERDDKIMREYELPAGAHPQYEIDHSIPPCLGGADADANLWPEPRRTIEPTWNAERKDELEAWMCSLVCSGQLDVVEAQKEIADDWTAADARFFPDSRVNAFPPAAGALTP
jgi:hypothetical protein